MPLQIHKMAQPAHRAAIAAGEQGKFWEFHDRLFATKKLSNSAIDTIAQELGLDMEKFKQDQKSPATQQKINKDLQDSQSADVNSTPTLFINGRRFEQQRSLPGFQRAIDEALRKLGN